MTELDGRLASQRERIRRAADRVGRSVEEITLIAVSKTRPAVSIRACMGSGVVDFGESYVPEWRAKASELEGVRWHFVGHLQSNKARAMAGRVSCIHSVDRPSLIRELDRAGRQQDVMIQVNVAGDTAKSGCAPTDVEDVLERVRGSANLKAVGLMTIGPLVSDPEEARPLFRDLRALRDLHGSRHADLRFLSMGMSDDLEVAVEEGATHVRVGTAIFGPRSNA